MNEKLKKILYVIGFLILSALIAFLIYFCVVRELSNEDQIDLGEENEEPSGSGVSLPGSEDGGQNIIDIGVDEENENNEDEGSESSLGEPSQEIEYQAPSEIADGGKTITEIISFENSFNPTLSPGGDILSYNKETGEFSRLDIETGESIILDSISYKGAENIEWSPDSTKVLAEFTDGSNVIYDFDKNKQ